VSKVVISKLQTQVEFGESLSESHSCTQFDPYHRDVYKIRCAVDSLDYMAKNPIVCKKYHYSVPETYLRIDACISLSKDQKTLIVYNTNDCADSTLKKLNKVEMKIKLEKVQGFIFGSFSTRFWMMRMGIN
jgi:hypothetical protein